MPRRESRNGRSRMIDEEKIRRLLNPTREESLKSVKSCLLEVKQKNEHAKT